MKPTRDAMGVNSINFAPNNKLNKITIAPIKHDNLLVPPYSILILLWPNNPLPPNDFVHPQKKLAVPCEIASNFKTAFFLSSAEII